MKPLALAALAAVLIAPAAFAEPPTYSTLPPDLAKAARAFDRAQIKGDAKVLAELLSDDYRLVNSKAEIETKADFIKDFTGPGFHLEPFTVHEPIWTTWPNGAVLAGRGELHGTDGGKPFSQAFHFADIWARRGGKWVVVFTEVTAIPKP